MILAYSMSSGSGWQISIRSPKDDQKNAFIHNSLIIKRCLIRLWAGQHFSSLECEAHAQLD